MLTDKLRHLKHVHDRFSAKHCFEILVRIDVTFILGILETVFLDVSPKSFTTSLRGIGPLPTITASSELMFMGFINAEFAFAIVFLLMVKGRRASTTLANLAVGLSYNSLGLSTIRALL